MRGSRSFSVTRRVDCVTQRNRESDAKVPQFATVARHKLRGKQSAPRMRFAAYETGIGKYTGK